MHGKKNVNIIKISRIKFRLSYDNSVTLLQLLETLDYRNLNIFSKTYEPLFRKRQYIRRERFLKLFVCSRMLRYNTLKQGYMTPFCLLDFADPLKGVRPSLKACEPVEEAVAHSSACDESLMHEPC